MHKLELGGLFLPGHAQETAASGPEMPTLTSAIDGAKGFDQG